MLNLKRKNLVRNTTLEYYLECFFFFLSRMLSTNYLQNILIRLLFFIYLISLTPNHHPSPIALSPHPSHFTFHPSLFIPHLSPSPCIPHPSCFKKSIPLFFPEDNRNGKNALKKIQISGNIKIFLQIFVFAKFIQI